MSEIRIAVVGVGNCASSLIQGLNYYNESDRAPIGLMHETMNGYRVSDIRVVAAFDIDRRKVGLDVSQAIFAKPNCTTVFCRNVRETGVTVRMGPVMDGCATHMKDYPADKAFRVAKKQPVDISRELRESGAEVLVN